MATTQQLRSAADRLIELHESGDFDGVLALADEVTELASEWDQPDEVVRESLFIARFQRAIVLTEREDLEAAADAYAQAAATPTDPRDPDQRHEVAMALLHRGMCLDALGDPAAAVHAYDDLVERFGEAEDAVTRDQVMRGRVNRAASLLNAGDADAALTAASQLVAELSPATPLDAEQWIMARRVTAAAFESLGRLDDAASILEAVAEVTLDDPAVGEQQTFALLDRAQLLEQIGQPAEASAAREVADSLGTPRTF